MKVNSKKKMGKDIANGMACILLVYIWNRGTGALDYWSADS